MKPQNEPKQVETSMSLPKQAEWEKDLRSVIDAHYENYGSKESLVTSMKAVISDLLSNQEAEHKEERNRVVETAIRQIDLMAEDELRDIEKLKQQHRAELEGLIKFIKDQPGRTDREVIMIQISKLLNSKEGE